jgi:hypothetical protein
MLETGQDSVARARTGRPGVAPGTGRALGLAGDLQPLDPGAGEADTLVVLAGDGHEGAGGLLARHDLGGARRVVGGLDEVVGLDAVGHRVTRLPCSAES